MIETKNFYKEFDSNMVLSPFDTLYIQMQSNDSVLYPSEEELNFEIKNDYKKYSKKRETLANFKKHFYDGIIYQDNSKKFIGAIIKKTED